MRLNGRSPTDGSEARKSHYRGTHRTLAPAQTKSRIAPYGRGFGLTRVANVTGLDYLGIPVFMAVRPNSRSLAVSQGKGLDEDSAWVSAFMEAAELEHAETLDAACEVASYAELRLGRDVVDPFRLPRTRGKPFDAGKPIPWIKADLVSGNEVWVPSELVHMDYRYPAAPNSNALFHSSNGLASGNDLPEAICAGLCELIERDAVCLWRERSATSRAQTRLILETVSDGDCRALLEHLARHEMGVAVGTRRRM